MPFRQWLPNVLLALLGIVILYVIILSRIRRQTEPTRGTSCA